MLPEPELSHDAPWKQRYRAATVSWTQIAAGRPERGLACGSWSGSRQLHAWDVPAGDAADEMQVAASMRRLTDKLEGIVDGHLSPDGHHVYYLEDEHGDETGHFVCVPWEGGSPVDVTPDLPRYSSWYFGFSRDGTVAGFVAAMENRFFVFAAGVAEDGSLESRREVYAGDRSLYGPALSHGGEIAVIASSEGAEGLRFHLIAVDARTGERLAELSDGPETSISPLGFSPVAGDFRVLATSDRSGIPRPLIWNPRTGERRSLQLDGFEGDVSPVCWSPDGSRVLLCQTHRAVQQLAIYELDTDRLTLLQHPPGAYGYFGEAGIYFGNDLEIFAQWQDASHPPQVIALDPNSGRQTRVVLPAGEGPPGQPWRTVAFRSSDGEEIQAWLLTPEGEGPFPAMLYTHGGPEAVFLPSFSGEAQMWADHGFAFLSVNYRGSTTFGREFLEKIWFHPGHWEVEDMAAGWQWLVDSNVALPDQVYVTGRSYGGYNTLQALGTKPDLWAGGMAGVAVADWVSQFEDESEAMRGVDIAFMGGTPEEQPEAYRAASPIAYCERVRAPVVIIQGRNDTRCPARQVALYEARMRELGKPIEVHWYDAGHFAASPEQAIEHAEIFLKFVYAVRSSRPGAREADREAQAARSE